LGRFHAPGKSVMPMIDSALLNEGWAGKINFAPTNQHSGHTTIASHH
jgi:hypothetical protein